MPSTDVCFYCKNPQSAHGPSEAGPEWFACPPPHERVVSHAHFRPAGPVVTCDRCGHTQLLPHSVARHLVRA